MSGAICAIHANATLRENLDIKSGACAGKKFDVLINLNGSDRSSWLTFLSGAKERLGRRPDDGGPPFWDHMFTAHVNEPFGKEPIYVQRCHCLERAGFPSARPEFHVEIAAENLRAAQISEADAGTYFHISPFTTADYKELSPEQQAELILVLGRNFPEKKVVLSCAPTTRELSKMENLLTLLPQKPWRVLAGNLNLTQIAAVIKHSAVHFCGDTGTLHLAIMTQTPVVTWFWPNPGIKEWVPADGKCHVVSGTNPPDTTFLNGISTEALIQAAKAAIV